eukprot:TRINITY_DN4246_c1_g1_i1.p1 TRINITY_DN4246_c1_g1~~TRINITY_DN4246_c1_g1_i1.p1  ORF type:complete len:330 (-),score=69.31 TRINITY_DN4246_c1_g1_i1:208-1197(-)
MNSEDNERNSDLESNEQQPSERPSNAIIIENINNNNAPSFEQHLQYSIQVIFNESMNILSGECIKRLSLISTSIHNIVKPFIETNFTFSLSEYPFGFYPPDERRLTHYLPKRVCDVYLSQVTLSPNEINDPIKQKFLNNLTHLEFESIFNAPIYNLPNNVTRLKLGNYFNFPVGVHNLPNKLTHLEFSWKFNQPISSLPHTIISIKFGDNFSQSVSTSNLPPNLRFLEFGTGFDLPIESLPSNITNLIFSYRFNQSVGIHNLPNKLTHLQFSTCFNTPLLTLPPSVVQVTFQGDPPKFNHPVSHLNPKIKFQTIDFFEKAIPCEYNPNR